MIFSLALYRLETFLLFHMSFNVIPISDTGKLRLRDSIPYAIVRLLPKSSLTTMSKIPNCGIRRGRKATKHEWVWGCCINLPLPFKGLWEYTGKAIFALAASYIWPKACFRHQCLWKRCENFSLSPGEWAVQILLETKERIGSSAFFNPNSFQMTHWASFIQTWIYPKAFLAKPSHSLHEPMQITLFKKVICYVKPTQLAVLDFSLPSLDFCEVSSIFSTFNYRLTDLSSPIEQCSL